MVKGREQGLESAFDPCRDVAWANKGASAPTMREVWELD